METSLKLMMTFKTTGDKTINLSIDDPRSDISEEEVQNAMNLIVEKNIFSPGDFDIKEALKAKIVQTETTEFDFLA